MVKRKNGRKEIVDEKVERKRKIGCLVDGMIDENSGYLSDNIHFLKCPYGYGYWGKIYSFLHIGKISKNYREYCGCIDIHQISLKK